MCRNGFVFGLFLIACGCTTPPNAHQTAASADTNATKLVFLTRGGCLNTATMRTNLDHALRSLGLPSNYEILDLDNLQEADARRGYPTPTLLYENRDVFGLQKPRPPLPEPT